MSKWNTTTKHEPNSINDGNRYETKDRLSKEVVNAITENAFYAMAKADEALEKADSAFQGNGTIITLNGQSQASMEVDSTPQESGTDRLITSAGVANALKNFTPSDDNKYDDTELRELIDGKVDKVTGKGLSTNDYTNEEKTKLAGLENYDDNALWLEVNANSSDINNKANLDASNLSDANVSSWKEKLNFQSYDDTEIKSQINNLDNSIKALNIDVSANTTNITQKANLDASNLTSTNVTNWKSKLGVPDISGLAKSDLSNVTYPTNTLGSTKTGAGDRVIETYISSDGKTWYRKYASGWKECGGEKLLTSATSGHSESAEIRVELPITFTDTNYTLLLSTKWSGSGGGRIYYYDYSPSRTTSSFVAVGNNIGDYSVPANSSTVVYYCRGY